MKGRVRGALAGLPGALRGHLCQEIAGGLALALLLGQAGCFRRAPFVQPGEPSGVLAAPPDYRSKEGDPFAQKGFSVMANIVAIDGESVRYWRREFAVPTGCRRVEVEVEYEVDEWQRPRVCLGFAPAGECVEVADYSSGRVPFVIQVRDRRRYELNTLADGEALRIYFVEVDPEQGTVAWFPPGSSSSAQTCEPGISLGSASR